MNKLTLNEPAKKGTKTVLSCADGVNSNTDEDKDDCCILGHKPL